MDFFGIAIASLGAGLLLLLGGALVVYMASLVKSAYELKLELQMQMNDGWRNVDEEMDKRMKWIKRELLSEIEKIRSNLNLEQARKAEEILARLGEDEAHITQLQTSVIASLDALRNDVGVLDSRFKTTHREHPKPAPSSVATHVLDYPDLDKTPDHPDNDTLPAK